MGSNYMWTTKRRWRGQRRPTIGRLSLPPASDQAPVLPAYLVSSLSTQVEYKYNRYQMEHLVDDQWHWSILKGYSRNLILHLVGRIYFSQKVLPPCVFASRVPVKSFRPFRQWGGHGLLSWPVPECGELHFFRGLEERHPDRGKHQGMAFFQRW